MNKVSKLSFEEVEGMAMSLPFVVGVSESESQDGKSLTNILVNCPVDEVQLPELLQHPSVQIICIGDIQAQ